MVRRGITSLWPCEREGLTANRDEDTFILMMTGSKKKEERNRSRRHSSEMLLRLNLIVNELLW